MQEVSEFRMPKSVLYGRNSLEKLGEQSKKLGKRAFIVTDTIMEKLGYLEKCIQQLNKKSITVSTYNKVDAEPTNIHVLEALSLC
ncbi:iron-containing alcohol dehydrogenase, partial [Bacillus thuringiensis]